MNGKHIPRIEVTRVTPLAPGSNLKAFISVLLDGAIQINDLRVVCQPNKQPWCAPPSREADGPDGKRRYYPVVEFRDSALRFAIEKAVLRAWRQTETGEVA